jgi:putative transposase
LGQNRNLKTRGFSPKNKKQMSHIKIFIHTVWATKNHFPYLTSEIKPKIIDHIKENAKTKGIHINRINGHRDHLHCLISLNPDMSISKTLQLIKGESAFWMNRQKITNEKFEWADEYYAASVSESVLKNIQLYIENQEEHHQKKSFAMEYLEFMRNYQFPG